MAIPLEDNFEDVIGKAQRGLKISDSELTAAAGISIEALQQARNGEATAETLARLALALGLNAKALAELPNYTPGDVSVKGLAAFSTPWNNMLVNSYVMWDEATGEAVAFDTGMDCGGLLDLLREKGLKLRMILLTHTHGDHIFDLDRLKENTGAPAFVSEREPLAGAEAFEAGREFQCGNLRIETRLTWGHSKGGITYVVHGLERPVAVVGDAIFAGSMGGGSVSYQDALKTNREQILALPPETVLCPGHGPTTTAGEEQTHNPFFASATMPNQ